LPIVKEIEVKVPVETGKRYAAASGDYNPYHISSILAKVFGFETALVQGYWSFSKTLAFLESENKIPAYPLRLECSFKKPVFLPSTVTLRIKQGTDNNFVEFDFYSAKKNYVHIAGNVKHEPNLKLVRGEPF